MIEQFFHCIEVLTLFIKGCSTKFTFVQKCTKIYAFFHTYAALVKLPYCRCLQICQSSSEPLLIAGKQSVWAEEESWAAKTRDNSILLPNWLPCLLLKTLCGSYIVPDHARTYLLPAFSTTGNLKSTRLKWRQEMLYTVKGRICIQTPWWALPVKGMKGLQLSKREHRPSAFPHKKLCISQCCF